MKVAKTDREKWVRWIKSFGAGKFYDAFVNVAQGAESTCIFCKRKIYLDIVGGGGIPDWCTKDGDYGCRRSPDTGEYCCGPHDPKKLR